MPLAAGGLIGGPSFGTPTKTSVGTYQSGAAGYYTGIHYTSLATPPIIIDGKLYYRTGMSSSGEKGRVPGFACVDLSTGKQLWQNATGNVDFGQVYDSIGLNGEGGVSVLYDASTSTSVIYDAFTGMPIYYLTGAVANVDKVFYGAQGDVYAIVHGGNTTQPWVAMWNSTKAFSAYGFLSLGSLEGIQRIGSYNWSLGLQYNVTTPSTAPFTFSQATHNMPADASVGMIMLIATPTDAPNNGSSYETGFNAITEQVAWGPIRRDWNGTYTNRVATGEGLYVQLDAGTQERVGISFTTGQILWTSNQTADTAWGDYTGFGANAYGLSIQGTYAGDLVALNETTGKQVWSFNAGNSGLETPYGSWPFFNGPLVGGYTVYAVQRTHTQRTPLQRSQHVCPRRNNRKTTLGNALIP